MKHFSIRTKITLWFALALIAVVAITYICILSVSNQVIQKTIKDNLIETVENNVDEIEYYKSLSEINEMDGLDHYIEYKNGYLEVDDDFLDSVNQVYTALYEDNLFMLYGENPIAKYCGDTPLKNQSLRKIKANGVNYYIFDRELKGNGLSGLWLRGVVAETQGKDEMTSISKLSLIILPIILIISILGGNLIARKTLSPIKNISDTASQIGKGNDLKKRIELSEGDDELHQLANNFNDMFARLDKSFEKEKQFTSDVSHELRTPMAVIMAQCEYSMEKEMTNDEYAESIESIYNQGRKMTSMINQMLDIARLEMKPENYPKEKIDFSALTESVCEDLALIRDKNINLSANIDKNIFINGNENLLTRAISNLILNAYRYGKENGYINVLLKEVQNNIIFEVEDNGIGISEKDLTKIFDRFYRADSSRTQGGTGLGLAITKEIVEFHGGKITAESKLGEGSKFTIIF